VPGYHTSNDLQSVPPRFPQEGRQAVTSAQIRPILLSITIGVLLLVWNAGLSAEERNNNEAKEETAKYLFICTGDQARTKPDFLAVANFDDDSPNYGRVVATIPFPAPNATGNEPHHIGISEDQNTVGCGGLLSILKAQDGGGEASLPPPQAIVAADGGRASAKGCSRGDVTCGETVDNKGVER